MLEFVNLIIIPFISLHIWYRRHGQSLGINVSVLCDYLFWIVGDLIVCSALMILSGRTVGISAHPDSMTYSIVSSFIAAVLPYFFEIIRKYIDIRVDISPRHKEKEKKD